MQVCLEQITCMSEIKERKQEAINKINMENIVGLMGGDNCVFVKDVVEKSTVIIYNS